MEKIPQPGKIEELLIEPQTIEEFQHAQEQMEPVELTETQEKLLVFEGRIDKLSDYLEAVLISAPHNIPNAEYQMLDSSQWSQTDYKKQAAMSKKREEKFRKRLDAEENRVANRVRSLLEKAKTDPIQHETEVSIANQEISEYMNSWAPEMKKMTAEMTAFRYAEDAYFERLLRANGFRTKSELEKHSQALATEKRTLEEPYYKSSLSEIIPPKFRTSRARQINREEKKLKPLTDIVDSMNQRGYSGLQYWNPEDRHSWYQLRRSISNMVQESIAENVKSVVEETPALPEINKEILSDDVRIDLQESLRAEFERKLPQAEEDNESRLEPLKRSLPSFIAGEERVVTYWSSESLSFPLRFFSSEIKDRDGKIILKGSDVFDALMTLSQVDDLQGVLLEIIKDRFQTGSDLLKSEDLNDQIFHPNIFKELAVSRQDNPVWMSAFHLRPLHILLNNEEAKTILGEEGVRLLRENVSKIITEGILATVHDVKGETIFSDHDNLGDFILNLPLDTGQAVLNILRDTQRVSHKIPAGSEELRTVQELVHGDSVLFKSAGVFLLEGLEWKPEEHLDFLETFLANENLRLLVLRYCVDPMSPRLITAPVIRKLYKYLPDMMADKEGRFRKGYGAVYKLVGDCTKIIKEDPEFKEEFFSLLKSSPEFEASFFEVASERPENISAVQQESEGKIDIIEEYRLYIKEKQGIMIDETDFKKAHAEVFSQLEKWKDFLTDENSDGSFQAKLAIQMARHPELLPVFQQITDNLFEFTAGSTYYAQDEKKLILNVLMRQGILNAESADQALEQYRAMRNLALEEPLDQSAITTLIPFLKYLKNKPRIRIVIEGAAGFAQSDEKFHQDLFSQIDSDKNIKDLFCTYARQSAHKVMPIFLGPEDWKQEAAQHLLKDLQEHYGPKSSLEEYYQALSVYGVNQERLSSTPSTLDLNSYENKIVKKLVKQPEFQKDYPKIGEELLPLLTNDSWSGRIIKCAVLNVFLEADTPEKFLSGIAGLKRYITKVLEVSNVEDGNEQTEIFKKYSDSSFINFSAVAPDRVDLIFVLDKKAPLLSQETYAGTRNFIFEHGNILLKTEEDLEFLNTLVGKYSKASDQIIKDYVVCLTEGAITTDRKKEVLEFLDHFRILTPNIIKAYLEAKSTGGTEIFLTNLQTITEKMIGNVSLSERERQSPYYAELLKAVYQNNAGNWSNYEVNAICEDRSADLSKYTIRPRYEIDLLSGGEIKIKQGEALDEQGVEGLKEQILTIARSFEKEGFDNGKMQERVGTEIEAAFQKGVEKGSWANLDKDAIKTPEEKLFLILAEQLYGDGATTSAELKNLLVSYQFAYLEDIRAYIQGTTDRVSGSSAPEYALLCELDNFFADKIKEVNRTLVRSAWENPAIAAYMPQYFKNQSERTIKSERTQQVAKLQVDKLGMNEGFLKQIKRVLEGKTGKKYTPEQVAYIIRRYEGLTSGLTDQRLENPNARNKAQTERFKSFRGQLKSQRDRTLTAVKVLTGKELSPEEIHLEEINLKQWLDSEQNIQIGTYDEEQFGTYTTQQLINMFADERDFIEGEISKFTSEAGNTRSTLHAYITKTKESANARMVGGVCVSGDNPPASKNMWDTENYIQMVFQDPKTSRCQGLNLMHVFEGSDTENGERVLTVSFNPSSTYLYSTDEAALFRGIMDSVTTFAKENNFDKILVSRNHQIRTNRTGGVFEQALTKAVTKVGKEYKFPELKRFSYKPSYQLEDMDVLWERT